MDSPVRQYLKLKDYQRHKLFRKIRRRRKAEAQQAIDAPMKELRRRLKRYGGGKDTKKELPYPLRASSDYDDNLAYQSGIVRDPKTGHMWSTTQEEYPAKRTYLKKPNHPTYGKAIWGDMAGGYQVYRRGDRDYAAPNFAEMMYTKAPFKYGGGKDEKKVYLDQSIDGVNLWRDNLTGGYFYLEGNGPRIDLTPFNTLGSDDPTTWSFLDAEGKEYNPRRQYTGPTISLTTDAQRVANEVRDILNTRTWRSDVADQLHNFGDALMWSTMAMNPEGEALMMKASEKVAPYVEKWADMAKLVRDIYSRQIPFKQKWNLFKNLDEFDNLRGINFSTDIYHGSILPFDIRNARNMNPSGGDTGIHFGETMDPTYSRANGLVGGEVYKGKLKLKELPFEVRDLGTWRADDLYYEAMNNPQFAEYLENKGVSIKQLEDLKTQYVYASTVDEQLRASKNFSELMLKRGVNLKYKNQYETVNGDVDKYSYVTWNKDTPAWYQKATYNEDAAGFDKLLDLGIVPFGNKHFIPGTVLDAFPVYRKPGPFINFNSGKDSGIHIKPENRGKFNKLRQRTGKSASWFKEHGTPALKKMATFALNARKWGHK